ncbi:unnamed protein product [Paramecium pentaurelia]|uniref:HECT domain-containing protein n=1 Tax=Paramecium pentaurelia TaxID=43138 RepID=A0A8S1XVP5_9CILI|nr:unnamed protein product [Paramecium pentaurelia]
MGCCASAASQISLPTNHKPNQQKNSREQTQTNEGKEKQQLQMQKNQDDQDQEIFIENQQQFQTDQKDSGSIPLKQTSPKGSQIPQNPYEYQEEQIEEQMIKSKKQNGNEKKDFNEPITKVSLEAKRIRKFVQKQRQLKSLQQQQNDSEQMFIIEEVERQINNKQLTLDSLDEICQKYNKPLIEVLSLINQQNYYIIELILIYINDYEIIQHILLNHILPEGQILQATALRLINKMKPFYNTKEQLQQTILFIQSIFDSTEVIRILNQLEFNNIDSYIDMKDQDQLKLFGLISKLFQKSEIQNKKFIEQYKVAKKNFKFQNLIVPKSIPLGYNNIRIIDKAVLEHLEFNIFHQIALQNKWDLFMQYSNDYYLMPNISQVTPMMMLFQNAPFDVINKYITLYSDTLEKSLHFFTRKGKNLIHCFCLNKSTKSIDDIQSIIDKLNQYQDLLKDLLIQPYNEQIPLVTYLDFWKEPQDILITFLSQHLQKEFDFYQIYLDMLQSAFMRNQKNWQNQRINPNTKYFYSMQNQKTPKRLRIKNYEEQDYQLYDKIYYQYIQVAKQIIKHKFKINLSWINNFDVHSTHYPYEFSGIVRPLLIQLVQLEQYDLVKKQVQLIKPFYQKQQIENNNEINIQAQYISKLIQLLKFTSNRSQLTPLIEDIKEIIISNPQLLKIPLHGYFEAKSKLNNSIFGYNDTRSKQQLYYFDCIYTQLIDLNDKSFDQCYKIKGLQFKQNEQVCLQIIRKLYLNNKLLQVDDEFINEIYRNITFVANFEQENIDSNDDQKNDSNNNEKNGRIQWKKSTEPSKQVINGKNYYKINHTAGQTRVILVLKTFNINDGPTYNFKEFIQFLKIKVFNYNIKNESMFDVICNLNQEENVQTLIELYFNDNFRNFPQGLHLLDDYFDVSVNSEIWCTSLFIYAQNVKFDFNFILDDERTISYTIFKMNENQLENIYNWGLGGMFLNLIISPKEYPIPKNYKEKAALYTIQNHKPFLATLITIKECYDDLTQIYPEIKITKDIVYKLSLKDIVQNNSFQSLNYILKYTETTRIVLASILAQNFFPLNYNFKKNMEEVEKFNNTLVQLFDNLKYDEDYSKRKLNLLESCHLYSVINLKSYQILKPSQQYIKFNHFVKIVLSCSYKEVKMALLNDMPDDILKYLKTSLNKICCKDQEMIIPMIKRIQLLNQNDGTLIYIKTILSLLFNQNPSKAIDILLEILDKKELRYRIQFIQHLYTKAFWNKDQETLNRLLGYLDKDPEKNTYKMSFLLRNLFSIDTEYNNYILALKYHPCLVLNTQQYQKYLKQNNFGKLKLGLDYQLCLREGLHEKIEILNQLIGPFDQIKDNQTFCEFIATVLIEAKVQPYNESLKDNQVDFLTAQLRSLNEMDRFQFLSYVQPYTLERKQLKQKNSLQQIINKAQEQFEQSKKIINHPIKKLEQINKLEAQLIYKQNQAYSKQNQNYSCLFQSSQNSQSQNYEKCFELVQKWANQKVMISKSPFYELMYALRYPNKQQVQQKEQLVEMLIKHFLLKKTGPNFLKYKSKEYIELLKANCSTSINKYMKYSIKQIRPQMQEIFVSELICEDQKYDPSNDDLDYIIMTMKYQNIKLVPILKKKYKGLLEIKFNKATLFYAKNEVNLLPLSQYDVSCKKFEKRMQFYCRFISGVGANLKKLTPDQVFLVFGQHNHILQKPQFSYENLILALISGNMETILFIIQLHQQPNKLVYEQNLFQLIILGNFSDNLVIKFFNKYIKDYVKQTNRIFQFDNQPILYYLMLMKRQKLFEDIYLQFMIQIHGEQKALQILKDELLIVIGGNNNQDILGLALMRKNYFILNYCTNIINKEHLKFIQHFDINYFKSIKPQNNNTPYSKFIELYQKYLPLCCIELKFKQFDKMRVQLSNGVFSIKNNKQINVREQQINQLIQYEQACINYIFNLKEIYQFHNKSLSIQMALDKWTMIAQYQFDPILLQQILQQYKQSDGSYNIKVEEYQMILEQCQKHRIYQHPIFDELAVINPKLFIQITNPMILNISSVIVVNQTLYQTPELINYIEFHYNQYMEQIKQQQKKRNYLQNKKKKQQKLLEKQAKSQNEQQIVQVEEEQENLQGEEDQEGNLQGEEEKNIQQQEDIQQQSEDIQQEDQNISQDKKTQDLNQENLQNDSEMCDEEQEREEDDQRDILSKNNEMQKNILYAFYLLLCIQQDQYQGWLSKQQQLKVIVEMYQILLKNKLKVKQQKPFITENSKIFILSQLNKDYKFKDFSYFEQILEKEDSRELAILRGIMYIQQINEIIKGFIDRLKEEITTMNNFKKNVFLVFGKEQISYEEDGFTIPLQYGDKSFYLSEESIAQAIPQLKIANYQMNIDVELVLYQEIQENWKNFDFSSITTVDFNEIIINSKENVLEKCLFFKNLMEQQFDKVGIYQIDDVFAPHQHEQIRQTDMQLFQTQGQPPSLIHQSQSQMGLSQGNQMQRQSTINQQQIMKEDFQFMFELLPDNTYQVRQQKKQKNQKELIFAEFYHFIQPQVVINLIKLTEEEFIANYNGNAVISMIIQDFYKYNEYLSSLIEQKQQQEWRLEFPFYIKNQHFIFQDQLFSTYNIQMIFTKLVGFIEKVQQLLGRSEDQSKLVWRINTISFLEVIISKLVELQQATNKIINIYSIIEQVFSWDTLIMILHQLLYNNLIKAQQVLKVIRGVYVEFNEQQGIQFVQSDQKKGLDKIFQFGNTTYLLYNHILIIRLNIGICNQKEQIIKQDQQITQIQKSSRSVFKPDPMIQEYFHSIINEYDFYNQIFNPEQLVQYLFNKLDIDRHLLKYSNQLSKILNKTITLSVDHQSLASIFSSEIYKISQNKNSKSRLKEMEQIWYILLKLNKYFKEDLYNYLQRQLKAERFDEMFNIRLSCLLSALRQNQSLMNIIVSNTRQLQLKQKSKILQRLCYVTQKSNIKLSYHFGFQISKNYYVNNSKLGDVCMIVYCENQKNNLVACQLVYNSKPGHFLFSQLDYMNEELLTHDRITRNQAQYTGYTYSHNELRYVQIEDLMSIVLFQPIWPSDPVFNQSILNVFFTDQDGNISICNEQKFLTLMSQIQCEQDEFSKQEMLDNLFGNGLVSSYSDLSLTQLTPIFPDQINFDFAAIHQLKKQQSLVQGQNVFVRINGDKFKLDQIEIASVSMACHFETNIIAQQAQKNFIKFLKEHTELSNIYLHFDDQLNQNPEYYLDCFLVGGTIFEAFQYGYQTFKDGYTYPKMNNSLQFLFEIQSILTIKINFIKTFIEKVEFIFEKSYENQKQLIQYENRTLKCYTLIDENDNIQVPDSGQIAQFLFNLILKFQLNKMNSYFTDENLNIVEVGEIQIENIKTVVDIILLAKYLFKLLKLDDENIKLNISILSQKEIKTQFKNTIYQFIDDGSHLIINYETFSDFNICDFFLDYLNNKQFYISNRYNDKIKYDGPEIILERLELNPIKLLSGIEDNQNIELLIYNLNKGKLLNLDVIDPNQFDQLYLIFKIDGIYQKFQAVKCCTYKLLSGYFKQTSYEQNISNSLFLLILDLESNKPLEPQLAKIDVQQTKERTNLMNLIKKEKKKEQLQVSYKFITNKSLLVEFFSDKILTMKLSVSQSLRISMIQKDIVNQLTFEYTTQNTQDLSKTTHGKVLIYGVEKVIEVEQEEQVPFGIGDAKMMKILLKKSNQKMDEILFHKQCEPIIHSKDLQLSNTINMLSKQELQAASRAGEERIDYLEFKDNLGNRINNFSYSSLVFVHSLFNQIQYVPQQEHKDYGLNLIWTPIFKGVYKLYIDDVRIKGRFIILANTPSLQESEIEIPQELQTIPFYEDIPFTFQLRDSYSNIYGDIEYDIYLDCKCEIVCPKGVTLQVNFQNLTKSGSINAKAHFVPDNVEANELLTEILILINKEIKKVKPIKISGVCLEKRRKKFEAELEKSFKRTEYSLVIRRLNFLKDLLDLADKKMNYNFSIKFQDEPGIDAGGLKREFYDMIGNTLKDDTYKFFQPVQGNLGKYFLHSSFNKIKNKKEYALLFGKLIANSIANGYLIGIDIISPFWKVVYDEKIVFEDLILIWDKQTYSNYANLRDMNPETIESLYLDFTYQLGNSTIELIPNGSAMPVTQHNVDQYLDKTAEYIIYKQFQEIYKSFIEGFTTVVDLKIFQKWLKPSEISLLTQGLLEIKPDVVLQKISYSGGKASHKSYFETYVNQADSQTLKNMLKFITGSSAIPFDQSSYIISVEFKNNLDIRKLPLAHTCFKSIEVPLYANYGQMKQKLDIAFTIGLEGYGFG